MFGILAIIILVLIVMGVLYAVSKLTKERPQASIPSESIDTPIDVTTGTKSRVEQLKELQSLLEAGLITREDFGAQKQRILNS